MVNCSIRLWIGLVWGFQTLGFLGKTHFSFWGFNAFFLYPLLDLLCASYGAILYDFHMPFFSKNKNTAKNMLTKIYIHELTPILCYRKGKDDINYSLVRTIPVCIYSYLSNKRTCPLILFKKKIQPTL